MKEIVDYFDSLVVEGIVFSDEEKINYLYDILFDKILSLLGEDSFELKNSILIRLERIILLTNEYIDIISNKISTSYINLYKLAFVSLFLQTVNFFLGKFSEEPSHRELIYYETFISENAPRRSSFVEEVDDVKKEADYDILKDYIISFCNSLDHINSIDFEFENIAKLN